VEGKGIPKIIQQTKQINKKNKFGPIAVFLRQWGLLMHLST